MKYDFLIVGAGFFGATAARILTNQGKKCLVIDKNSHLAGASHDFTKDQIIVSSYGAHIFHTNSEKIWEFVNLFGRFEPFINKPKVLSGNKVYSFPINMMTLHQLWGVITPKDALQKLKEIRIPCENPRNFEEWALDKIGKEIYEKFIYGYTKKQWMKEPSELPTSIIQRLPIRLTYEENYFTTKYQAMPQEGYTKIIENMLDGIEVKLETDFFNLDWKKYANNLIYSGPVDKLFQYEYGKLEFNTLKFVHQEFTGDYQGNAVFNHTDITTPYLRSVEHKHFKHNHLKHYTQNPEQEKTIITYDYPISFEENPEPYYPIRNEKNILIYEKYLNTAKKQNIHLGGRLGLYVYCDIDQTIASAMTLCEKL